MQTPLIKTSIAQSAVNTTALTARLASLSNTIAATPAVPATISASTLQLLKQPALVTLAAKDQTLATQIATVNTQATSAQKAAQTKLTACQSALAAMLQSATALLKP